MNVSSVSSTSALLGTAAIASTSDVTDLTGVAGTDTSGVSKMADLMSQLQALAESDPDKLKEVMNSLAEQLQEAAGSTEGGEAGFLEELAQKFADAAESGDVSSLKPPEPPPQGSGPPPQKAKAAYQANGQQPSVDLAQLIQNVLAQYGSSSTSSTTAAAP